MVAVRGAARRRGRHQRRQRHSGAGGLVSILAGRSPTATGGALSVQSGEGAVTSSGLTPRGSGDHGAERRPREAGTAGRVVDMCTRVTGSAELEACNAA